MNTFAILTYISSYLNNNNSYACYLDIIKSNDEKIAQYSARLDKYTCMAIDCYTAGRVELSKQFADRADTLLSKIANIKEKNDAHIGNRDMHKHQRNNVGCAIKALMKEYPSASRNKMSEYLDSMYTE